MLKLNGAGWLSAAAHMAYRAQVAGRGRPAGPCGCPCAQAGAAQPALLLSSAAPLNCSPPAAPQDGTHNRDLAIASAVGQALVGALCLQRGFADD